MNECIGDGSVTDSLEWVTTEGTKTTRGNPDDLVNPVGNNLEIQHSVFSIHNSDEADGFICASVRSFNVSKVKHCALSEFPILIFKSLPLQSIRHLHVLLSFMVKLSKHPSRSFPSPFSPWLTLRSIPLTFFNF